MVVSQKAETANPPLSPKAASLQELVDWVMG
jgi:hypothetical protein